MAKAPGKFLNGLRRFLGLDRPKYQRPLRPKAYERPRRPKAYLSNPERDRLHRGETELEDAMEVASGPMYPALLSDVQHTRRMRDGIMRERACRHCGKVILTKERVWAEPVAR